MCKDCYGLVRSLTNFVFFSVFSRAVLVREAEKPGDEPTDVTPIGFSVRSTTQEYGGGAFNLAGNIVVFSNLEDQRLYKQFLSSQG